MSINNAVVEAISRKEVETKFGTKPTFSIKLRGGDWYSCGFTDPKVGKEDVISFEYEETKYGKQITPKTLTKGSAKMSASIVASSNPTEPSRPTYGSKGVFPIPALDGSRAIVRQNALTNARELIGQTYLQANILHKTAHDVSFDGIVAARIIAMARMFEAYTAGDLDMEEAQKEFTDESKAS